MKKLSILLISFIFFSCKKDNNTNDLQFFDINGKVKEIKIYSHLDSFSQMKLKDTLTINNDDLKFFKFLGRKIRERNIKNSKYGHEEIRFDSLGFFVPNSNHEHLQVEINREKNSTEINQFPIDKKYRDKGNKILIYSKMDSLIEINLTVNYPPQSHRIPLDKSILVSGIKIPLEYRENGINYFKYDEIRVKTIKNQENLDSVFHVYSKNKLEYLMYILEYDSLNNWTDRVLISDNFSPIFQSREIDYYFNNNK